MKVRRQEAPRLSVPMYAGAADAVARKKTREAADRHRRLARIVAKRQRLLVGTQKQIQPNRVAKFVLRISGRKVRRRIAPGSTFDRDDVQASLCEFIGKDRDGPSEPDDDDILGREFAGHRYSLTVQSERPMMLTGGNG